MNERSILITGASSGIGLAAAQSLQARGWRVLATARKAADIERLRVEEGLEVIALELSDPASVEACADEALKLTNGRLTALYNNGAYGQVGAVEDLPTGILREQFEVNLFACVELTRVCLDRLRASRGQILFVNSGAGLQSSAGWSAYAASKFALRAFTDALDAEERPNGIRVMGVYPGRTATAMQLKVRAQEGAEYEPETYTQPETLAGTIKTMLETPRDSILTQVIVSRMG